MTLAGGSTHGDPRRPAAWMALNPRPSHTCIHNLTYYTVHVTTTTHYVNGDLRRVRLARKSSLVAAFHFGGPVRDLRDVSHVAVPLTHSNTGPPAGSRRAATPPPDLLVTHRRACRRLFPDYSSVKSGRRGIRPSCPRVCSTTAVHTPASLPR